MATLESPAAGGQPLAKVTPVTHAESKTQAVSPKPVRDTLLAFLIGIVLGLIVLFVKNRFDRTVTSTADLEDIGSSLIFGSLPFSADLRDTSLVPFNKGASALAERSGWCGPTSPSPTSTTGPGHPDHQWWCGRGQETTAVNLARCLAEAGKTVILATRPASPGGATALEINRTSASPTTWAARLDHGVRPAQRHRALSILAAGRCRPIRPNSSARAAPPTVSPNYANGSTSSSSTHRRYCRSPTRRDVAVGGLRGAGGAFG